MNRRNLSYQLLRMMMFVVILSSSSCSKNNQFTIEGDVSGAENKMIYLEHINYSKAVVIDSFKLKGNGSFKFNQLRPAIPDFYRLRLDGRVINVAIDSTETVVVHANAENFATGYAIEGSKANLDIRELALLQMKTAQEYNRIQKAYDAHETSAEEFREKGLEAIGRYKTSALKYIYGDPKSTVAYFALFQQVNNLLIFDPYDRVDNKAYSAVATSWNQYYPNTERSKHLYDLTLQGLKVIRGANSVEYGEVNAKDYFDILLPNVNGQPVKLSGINEGKVILLDFTAYGTSWSPMHVMQLGEIYEKYKDKGFDIYQVSLDTDEHLWKNAAVNVPWVCVRDPQSVYSEVAGMYNVKEIPTSFILNRNGEIVKRLDNIDDLEAEIKTYL